MSELERTVTAGAAERVIRSYVGTKSERSALAALSRLLMDSDPLAIPVRLLSEPNLTPSHTNKASSLCTLHLHNLVGEMLVQTRKSMPVIVSSINL